MSVHQVKRGRPRVKLYAAGPPKTMIALSADDAAFCAAIAEGNVTEGARRAIAKLRETVRETVTTEDTQCCNE